MNRSETYVQKRQAICRGLEEVLALEDVTLTDIATWGLVTERTVRNWIGQLTCPPSDRFLLILAVAPEAARRILLNRIGLQEMVTT